MAMSSDGKPIEISNSALALAGSQNLMGRLEIYTPN